MSNETAPLLSSYHDEQHERTQQLLAAQHTTPSAQDDHDDNGYPIDHGRVAWMQVLGGFILFANSWYILLSLFSSFFPSLHGEKRKKKEREKKSRI